MGALFFRHVGAAMEGYVVKPLTVLVAVYNSPIDMFDQAVDSVLAQNFREFELLIVDDGSPDETFREHVRRKSQDDSRIRIVWEQHRGLTASLNHGLRLANSEFIARHDADDWSSPERFKRQIAYFESHPNAALCGTNAWTHQENGTALWHTHLPESSAELLAAFPRGNPFVHGATMFRLKAAVDIGGYREVFRCSQDYDFFWRLAERYDAANLAEPLYHYRYTSSSISARRASDQLQVHIAIRNLAEARERGGPEDPQAEFVRARVDVESPAKITQAMMKQADHIMLAGDYRRAAQSYMHLLRAHPASPLAWARFARLGLFRTVPFLREACF
jgi:hypothetical protein